MQRSSVHKRGTSARACTINKAAVCVCVCVSDVMLNVQLHVAAEQAATILKEHSVCVFVCVCVCVCVCAR